MVRSDLCHIRGHRRGQDGQCHVEYLSLVPAWFTVLDAYTIEHVAHFRGDALLQLGPALLDPPGPPLVGGYRAIAQSAFNLIITPIAALVGSASHLPRLDSHVPVVLRGESRVIARGAGLR